MKKLKLIKYFNSSSLISTNRLLKVLLTALLVLVRQYRHMIFLFQILGTWKTCRITSLKSTFYKRHGIQIYKTIIHFLQGNFIFVLKMLWYLKKTVIHVHASTTFHERQWHREILENKKSSLHYIRQVVLWLVISRSWLPSFIRMLLVAANIFITYKWTWTEIVFI